MDWKEQFLDLYMSELHEEFSRALDLKRNSMPQKLYRYRPISYKNIQYIYQEVCAGEIYMARSSEMNDPFDACSVLESHKTNNYVADKEIYVNIFKDRMSEDEFAEIFQSAEWYDRLIMWCCNKEVPHDAESTKAALEYAVMKQIEELNEAINSMIHKMARYACFTEDAFNLPMWNHYADSHKGICLEYDTSCISDIYTLNRLFPIYYKDKLPDGVKMMKNKKLPSHPLVDYFLIHKLNDWSYEKEWRLIYDVGSWYYSHEDVPEEFWYSGKQIKFIRPTKIYLGAKIEEAYENELRKWGEKLSIPVVRMKYTQYGLEAE